MQKQNGYFRLRDERVIDLDLDTEFLGNNNIKFIDDVDTNEHIKKTDWHFHIRNKLLKNCYLHDVEKNNNIIKESNDNIVEIFKKIELNTINSCYVIIKYMNSSVIEILKRFSNSQNPLLSIASYIEARNLFKNIIYGSSCAEKSPIQIFFQSIPKNHGERLMNNYIEKCENSTQNYFKKEYTDFHINEMLLGISYAYGIDMTTFDIIESIHKINSDIKIHVSRFFASLGNVLLYLDRIFFKYEQDAMKYGQTYTIQSNIFWFRDCMYVMEKLITDITHSYEFNSSDRDKYFGTDIFVGTDNFSILP